MKIILPPTWRFISRAANSGFSLSEVVIALGVFSFAIMGVLGVLPTAVSTIREASEQQVMSDILTQVASDMRSASRGVETIDPAKEFPRYFDNRGMYLGHGGDVPKDAAYLVDFTGAGPISHDNREALNSTLYQISLALKPIYGGGSAVVIGVGYTTL